MTATLMIAVAVLSFILVAIILYIFYPALAIAKYKSKVTEEVLSKDQYSGKPYPLNHYYLRIVRFPTNLTKLTCLLLFSALIR